MKRKLKKILWFFANPRLLLCFGIGWIITNGWSYIMLALGIAWDVGWMQAVAGAYLAFLWFPFTPEKIVTVIIAIFLLRVLFPNDKKTLAVLKGALKRAKDSHRKRKEKRRAKKEAKRQAKGGMEDKPCEKEDE